MAITKNKKQEILAELEQAATSPSVVFAQFKGLTAQESNALRVAMRQEGVSFKVAKKTLIERAFAGSTAAGDMPTLEGEIALAWGNDLIAPARETQKFNKTFAGKIAIAGGVFEGRFMNQSEMMEIATIPETPVLRGMFVNVINSPIQGLVIALQAIADKKS
ncbi:MAG: 50S ribosomal protein L10 [Candidatus Pacebacteria bacterium]|nr:50S ribosomal protein L10 [Candidatus Paceibacterota bacterium]MCD8507987.1 50S ribosomal protein L10 [Candidatus Paceibacterota bacterium]MCD8528076.1 50S ribosomal protein L10 [Candidatus Paceibacterota bacterium]MCD8564033.1 50S ribosomal protein L10 [Candidatus Paceibacterota bacterium]